ncbi:hypothetical protein IKG50_04335 [Candidatus Saccharibacteria bacterium]|nr:hypothetical protein [Candidatus Saccharibacteria bacterium]
MLKTKFTLKNYFKELKKAWLLLVIFAILGAAGGAFYAFKKPVKYTTSAIVLVNNSKIDNGAVFSPYAQITELLSSKNLLQEINKDLKEIPEYTVFENPRGVFAVTVTDDDPENAKKVADTIINSTDELAKIAFDNPDDYRITIVKKADDATPTITTKTRLMTIAIAAGAMLVLAAVIVFIKFDYCSEK